MAGLLSLQLPGPGNWGEPRDPDEAVRVLRRAIELGINFIETADAYGPFTADLPLKKALHPYADDLVIATKAGFTRQGPGAWAPVGRPTYLRQAVELSLRHLGLERIDLLQLPRIDPQVPVAGQVGEPAATVDAISARSGVSKATIYKHWPCRTAIAAEAFGKQLAVAIPLPDRGNAVDDLTEQVRGVSEFSAGPHGAVFAQLLAACVADPAASPYFREYFLDARRGAVSGLWQRALDRGEVTPEISAETAADVLFGPPIFRLLTGHAALTPEEADKISSACLRGLLTS